MMAARDLIFVRDLLIELAIPLEGPSVMEAQLHISAQMGGGGGKRGPQSAQSVP